MKPTKAEAKSDALTLVVAAKNKCMNNKWKTRQDYRSANEVYRFVCAAENALTKQIDKGVEFA